MKIGFFGGSFNPPTYAHLEIARISIQEQNLDRVYFVPVGNSYKKPELIDENYRYEMLQIMSKNFNNIDVENIELNKNESISAIQAFEMIEKKYEGTEIYFIMGADNFIKMPTWKNAEELITKYNYIVFNRHSLNLENFIKENGMLYKNKEKYKIIQLKENKDTNSSIIRKLINEGKYQEADKYTSKEVIEYIVKNNLYQ